MEVTLNMQSVICIDCKAFEIVSTAIMVKFSSLCDSINFYKGATISCG